MPYNIVVKKYLVYLLFSLYLISFSEVRQMAKLPLLIEHFISHENKDHSLTFWGFIKMHYLDVQVQDGDYEQDMQLPFKKRDFSIVSLNMVTPPKNVEFSFEPKVLTFKKEVSNFNYSEKFYPSVFQKIWQPPKI